LGRSPDIYTVVQFTLIGTRGSAAAACRGVQPDLLLSRTASSYLGFRSGGTACVLFGLPHHSTYLRQLIKYCRPPQPHTDAATHPAALPTAAGDHLM
jgi:hypothetical protein